MHIGTILLSFLSLTSAAPYVNQVVLQNDLLDSTLSDTNSRNVFNAIHAAMRQWGSSLQHNGMSFFPAYVPERTLLYHGSRSREKVTGMEWLAFEIDHAEIFALASSCLSGGCGDDGEDRNDPLLRRPHPAGYLHVYQTTRRLDKLLYIDGMGAAKTILGTQDTQDILLLNTTLDPMDDFKRGDLLCDLGRSWGVEGFIRMEAGFEIILCNFSNGLDLVSNNGRPLRHTAEAFDDRYLFEYIRSVSLRYFGIGASRVVLDFSSMVSAFFYPVNLSNPQASAEYPRLISSDPEQLSIVRAELRDVFQRPRTWNTADWQSIVDMIISRYDIRLRFLVSNPSKTSFLATVNHLLIEYIDFGDIPQSISPIKQCSSHFLHSVILTTPQDEIIHNAIYRVTERICTTLFNARNLLLLDNEQHLLDSSEAPPTAIHMTQELVTWLDWATLKQCPTCAPDEVCFVASWPFGEPEDHYSPGCRNNTEMRKRHGWGSYWSYNETDLRIP